MGDQTKIGMLNHIAVIIFSAVLYCMLFTSQAEAETAYRTWEGEAINGYSISREETLFYNDSLCCSLMSCKGFEEVMLDERYYHSIDGTVSLGGEYINEAIVTNGETVYYSVTDHDSKETIIYKISITGKNRTKVKTIKNIDDWYNLKLITVYNGKLYYTYSASNIFRTCEYNLKTKKTKRIFKGSYEGGSGYGANIIMSKDMGQYLHNVKSFSYNVKTKKKYTLPSLFGGVVTSKGIYYRRCSTNTSTDKISIYKCSFRGTNKKKLLSCRTDAREFVTEINRKYIKYEKNGKVKTLYFSNV